MSKYKWFGNDASNKVSLLEQGMLMRRRNKGEYEAYVQCGHKAYAHGNFHFDSWVEILDDPTEKETWGNIGSIINENDEEYRKHILEDCGGGDSGAAELLFDMLANNDIYDVLIHPRGCDMPVYTENEVRIRLNKALAA